MRRSCAENISDSPTVTCGLWMSFCSTYLHSPDRVITATQEAPVLRQLQVAQKGMASGTATLERGAHPQILAKVACTLG